jgi:hypothetical protein
MAELNEKVSISGSKTELSEQSGVDWNNRIKIEKKVQYYCTSCLWPIQPSLVAILKSS